MQINDFTYTPLHSEENMAAAKKWLVEAISAKAFQSTANFAFINADSKVVSYYGEACHNSMGYSGTPQKTSVLVATEVYLHQENRAANWKYCRYDNDYRHIRYDKSAELMVPFFEWAVYESVYGRFILNRDDRESVETGFIVSSAVPASIMQSIMILSRHFYELCPESFEAFNRLRSMGVPGSVAYVVSFNTAYGSNTDYGPIGMGKPVTGKWGHRLFAIPATTKELHNFITGNAIGLNQSDRAYCARPSTHGTSTLFCNSNLGGQSPFTKQLILNDVPFAEMLRKYRGGNTSTSIINPFVRHDGRTPSQADVTYEELYNVIIPYLYERGDFKHAIH